MILVTGATGMVGRSLVANLLADGAEVRAITRDRASAMLSAQVDVVQGDLHRPETLKDVFDGISAIFVNPRAVGDSVSDVLALSRSHGVRRAVVLSSTNVDDDFSLQPSRFRGDRNKEVEDAVMGSGLDWVSIRSATMAPNTIGLFGAQIRAGDLVRGPYPTATEAIIDPADVSAVAAVALRRSDLDQRRIDVTGPQSLTQSEMVDLIGAAIGRTLRYQEIPHTTARTRLVDLGFSPQFADANLARLSINVGKPAMVTGNVAAILGRPATPYSSWLTSHIDEFVKNTA
jgi:uncharacterized protein YbjT (DUF2867 family)